MSYGVTPEGFVKKTFVEVKTELESQFLTAFGSTTDLSSEGPIGQIIGIFSKATSDMWDLMEEVYTSRNVNEATGASLDNILSEVGLTRIDSSATQITDVLLWGNKATVILTGKKATQSSTGKTFQLLEDVTISDVTVRGVRVAPIAPPAVDTIYSLDINGTTVAYTSIADDDEQDVIAGLLARLTVLVFTDWGTDNGDGILQVANTSRSDFSLANITANLEVDSYANAGIFDCTEEGVFTAPVGTLDTIATPVIGWLDVSNPFVGNTGRLTETDAQFRLRHSSYYSVGKGTEDAISQTILNEAEGIISCVVESNRTNGEVAGRPPHSFEVIVEGGDPQEICNLIWATAPAGVGIYWNPASFEKRDVVDSEGYTHEVGYSKPQAVRLYVLVRRAKYAEEAYPYDGDIRIRQAIVDWTTSEFTSGKDVVIQRFAIPVYSVPGIGQIKTYVSTSAIDPNIATEPVMTPISITDSQLAYVDTSDIVIQDLV